MTDKVRLIAPHLTVLMDDGAIHEIQADNRDLLDYERTARKRGWPSPQDGAQMEWMTYIAWHGLHREGIIPKDVTYNDFCERAVSIDPRPATTDPTQPGPEAG
jgi:hypothetical protein